MARLLEPGAARKRAQMGAVGGRPPPGLLAFRSTGQQPLLRGSQHWDQRPIPAEPTTAQPLCEARKRWRNATLGSWAFSWCWGDVAMPLGFVQGLPAVGPGLHDDFLLSQSVADAEAGFCTPPLTWSQLLRETQGKPIRLIPRCVIQQFSGKQRIIDNAHTGGQSAFSSESNRLVLCSCLRARL